MTVGAYSGPILVKKLGGVRPLVIAGPIISAIGLAWLTLLPASGSYLGHVLVPQLLVTLGAGLITVPLVIAATSGVAPAEAGVAAGIINTTRQFGGAIGLAVLASIAASQASGPTDEAGVLAGQHLAFGVGAAFVLVSVIFTAGLGSRAAAHDSRGADARQV